MKFTIEITDPNHLKGLTLARGAYNNSLPPEYKPKKVKKEITERTHDKDLKEIFVKKTIEITEQELIPIEERSTYLKTDQEYIQFVMSKACESYANQHGVKK